MTFLGDPLSIAPEVVQGMPVTTSADIYALGTLLFEWLIYVFDALYSMLNACQRKGI
jgi:serine/threonine protein kinase